MPSKRPSTKRPTSSSSKPKTSTTKTSTTKTSTTKARAPQAGEPKTSATRTQAAKTPRAVATGTSAPSATAPPPAPTEIEYTLAELHARLGDASEAEVAAFIEGATDEDLIAEGRQVDTSRIDTDTSRIYGRSLHYIERTPSHERSALKGVSRSLLRVGVWAALQGSERYVALHTGIRSVRTARSVREDAASGALLEGRDVHRQLAEALDGLAPRRSAYVPRIAAASIIGTSPTGLAGSLRDLVAVGRDMLADPSPLMKIRLADGESGLTAEWLAEVEALATRIQRTSRAASTTLPATEVSQAEVDRWDGINLLLLDRVIRAFETAHARDPRVPRLVPIALRTYFRARRRRAEGSQDEPGAPTGGAAR